MLSIYYIIYVPTSYLVFFLFRILISKILRIYNFFSLQADDDTFVDIPQLKKLLQKLDSTKNIYLGYVLRHGNRFWMSGGAGYIFSSAAFRTLIFSQFEDQTQLLY